MTVRVTVLLVCCIERQAVVVDWWTRVDSFYWLRFDWCKTCLNVQRLQWAVRRQMKRFGKLAAPTKTVSKQPPRGHQWNEQQSL